MFVRVKKTLAKWMMICIAVPTLLIIILFALLYIPPIQRALVDKATEMASEETGMDVRIGGVSLSFPLDFAVNDIVISKPSTDSLRKDSASMAIDTIAVADRVIVEVEMLPLFSGRVMINAFDFEGVKINTSDLVSAALVEGTIERFALRSRGIDLGNQEVILNDAHLSGADISVSLLNDTTAADTTTSEAQPWRILIDNVSLERTDIALHTIGDTTSVRTKIGMATLKGGEIDPGKEYYAINTFTLSDGALSFDNNMEDSVGGLDFNHIALDSIHITLDSIFYNAPDAQIHLRQFALREKSGLEIVNMECLATMDSTTLHVPTLKLLMPSSDLEAMAKVDLNVMNEENPGQIFMRLYASVGKDDVMAFCSDMPQTFRNRYPASPLIARGSLSGNMQHIDISGLSLELPTAFDLSVSGSADNITDTKRLKANIQVDGETGSLAFIEPLFDEEGNGSVVIPDNITLDGIIDAKASRYDANFIIRQDSGTVTLAANYDTVSEIYAADVAVSNLNLNNFLPKDSLYAFSGYVKAEGEGLDFFDPSTTMTAESRITEMQIGSLNANKVQANVEVNNGRARATIESHNPLAEGTIDFDALISRNDLDATLTTDIRSVDFQALRLAEHPLIVSVCSHLDMESDLGEVHRIEGYINDFSLISEEKTYRPADVTIDAFTNPDTIYAKMESGDMRLSLRTSGGYMKLMETADSITAEMARQREQRIIDQIALESLLPKVNLRMSVGKENPVADIMRYQDIKHEDFKLTLSTSPEDGITGRFRLFGLKTDSMQIDTIRMSMDHDSLRYLRFHGEVANRRNNPTLVFRSVAEAYFFETKVGVDMKYFDADRQLGAMFGVHAEMQDSGIHVHFTPDRPIIGYKEFNLNHDNYIMLSRDQRVTAGIDLIADDGMGVKLFSADEENEDKKQDITASINNFDLSLLKTIVPYMSHMTGKLSGDVRFIQDREDNLTMLSSLDINKMTYDKHKVGDIDSEFAYLLREDGTHVVDATLNHDNREIAALGGSYHSEGEGALDAILTLSKFPLAVANAFIPNDMLGFAGYAVGDLAVSGTASNPILDGKLNLDSTSVYSTPYGLSMRADEKPVVFNHSRLTFDNYSIYSSNNQPLTINGNIDFSDLDAVRLRLRMRAKNYQLINAKKQKGSIAYGKAFVNFMAGVNGSVDDLRVRGRLDVLGKTDITYILKDSPLSTDERLSDLVTFTDFSDTSKVKVSRPPIGGLNMQLTVNVENSSRVMCALNAAQTNYVSIEGGGEMRMLYNSVDGIQLFGRYTVNEGKMKYSLPIIPLKTFNLQKDDYLEFTGNVMNPRLHLTATEQMRCQVSSNNGESRSVDFDCGVRISQTLENLGLEFILDAPSDLSIKSELATMSAEQRNKLAITMLTTGMYLNDGNSAFTVNNALNAFLQSEINNLTSNAMGSMDFNLGLDQKTDAAGQTHTDYSFKFAKRFWNNRISLIVGGKVSGGSTNNALSKQNNSLIDNVSLEYRLDNTAQRNVRLFYNRDGSDPLEAERVSEYGAGFVWRKKMNSLDELFKSSKTTNNIMRRPIGNDSTAIRRDSITTKPTVRQ